MYNITYQFEQKGLEPITFTGVEDGQSLLEVALINDINLHHNCGGVCACSTCHIYIEQGDEFLEELKEYNSLLKKEREELNDREEDFIDRAVSPRINSRLGCQCVLQSGSGNIVLTLPDQSQFLGE